jgi:hypothetical protein
VLLKVTDLEFGIVPLVMVTIETVLDVPEHVAPTTVGKRR